MIRSSGILWITLLFPSFLFAQAAWVSTSTAYDTTDHPYNFQRHECGAGMCEVNGTRTGVIIGGRGANRTAIRINLDSFYVDNGAKSPIELHHIQACVWRDSIIVAGMGFAGGFPIESPSANLVAYNVPSDSWQVLESNIPIARRRGSAASILDGDWMYFFCGLTNGHQSGWVSWTDRYNLVTGSWEKLEDAPRARDHSIAVVHNRNVYVVGGRRSAHQNGGLHAYMVDSIDVFNLDTHTWSTLTSTLPTPRAGLIATILTNEIGNPQLSVWGGEYAGGTYRLGEGYDLVSGNWINLPSLSASIHATQLIKLNEDSLFVMAGASQGGSERTADESEYVQLYTSEGSLPVEWISFKVENEDKGVKMNWIVEEVNNHFFSVERKRSAGNWVEVNQVVSKGDGRHSYTFIDQTIPEDGQYVYRIKQQDWDGKASWSNKIELYVHHLISIFPNPVNLSEGERQLQISGDIESVYLYGLNGKAVQIALEGKRLTLPSDLPPAIYLLKITIDEANPIFEKLWIR